MFSLSYITPCIFLYQTEPPYLIDAKKSNLPKHKKHGSKTKGYRNASKSDSLSVPCFSEDLPFPTYSHFSTSHANVHNSNNVLVYDVKPTNQPIDSTALGHLLQSCSNVEEIRRAHAVVVKCMKILQKPEYNLYKPSTHLISQWWLKIFTTFVSEIDAELRFFTGSAHIDTPVARS